MKPENIYMAGVMNEGKCKVCDAADQGGFRYLGANMENEGLEISLNGKGILRARVYPNGEPKNVTKTTLIRLTYCPICGRHLSEGSPEITLNSEENYTDTISYCDECGRETPVTALIRYYTGNLVCGRCATLR